MTHASPVLNQQSFRARNDDGSETAATWKAPVNTDWQQDVDTVLRIRFLIQETNGGSSNNVTPQLQYNRNSAGFNDVNGASSFVRSVSSSGFADGDNTTQQLGSGTFISPNSGMDENNGLAGEAGDMDFAGNDECEAEFAVFLRGADGLTSGDTLEFRVTNGGTVLDNYTNTPTLTISGTTVVETDGNSSGSAIVSGVSGKTVGAAGSSDGVAAVSGAAAFMVPSDGSSDGAALVTGQGALVRGASGTIMSVSTVNFDASFLQAGEGSIAGVGGANADSLRVQAAGANAPGVASVNGISGKIVACDGNADGLATVSGITGDMAPTETDGNSDGLATVSGESAWKVSVAGDAAGSASVNGDGAWLALADANADGQVTVSGVSGVIKGSSGNAAGSSSAIGLTTDDPAPPGEEDGFYTGALVPIVREIIHKIGNTRRKPGGRKWR